MKRRDACRFFQGPPKEACWDCSLSWAEHYGPPPQARAKIAPAPQRSTHRRSPQEEVGGVRVNRRTPDGRPLRAWFGERDE